MITIKIKDSDISRYLKALEKLETTVLEFGRDEMQRRCAVDYFQLVTKNIMKRKRPSPAYSKRYQNWKYEYGWLGYPSPWRLRGDLVQSLSAFKNPGAHGWIGGVPIGAMDQGGKSWFGKGAQGPVGPSKSIAMYGSVEERRRPVFKPTAEEYAKTGWPKRGQEMLNELKKAWS